ncbi:MAG: DinB family protein [Anaerolineae bacterium]|nr:DinB family protein [Anaerolineae bacterium]
MSIHPLVTQQHFARSEFVRCLDGVSAEEGRQRFEPMNCISWMVGHLANQEHFYWVVLAQSRQVMPGLNDQVGYGRPASQPPLDEMWHAWREITLAADEFLEALTTERLLSHLYWQGKPRAESIGTMLLRNTYHYWHHLGEAYAIRQLLGHRDLPEFVGDLSLAQYRPEPASPSR